MSDFDIRQWGNPTPHDLDANDQGGPTVLSEAPPFPYVGKVMTLAEFAVYLQAYDFGPIPPDWLMLHHTAIPTYAQWVSGEAGLNEAQVKAKRLKQLTGIKNYYNQTLGWNAGPHIFCDDKYAYLMTPMASIGIHARDGNSTHVNGRLHYSIGIEVVGDYTYVQWPASVAAVVSGVVARLYKRLGNFRLVDGSVPGTVDAHRHHGKPACPGNAIQPSYYLPLFEKAVSDLASTAIHGAYIVKGLPVYRDSRLTQPTGIVLLPGTTIQVDRVSSEQPADYAPGVAHLADGSGFIQLDGAVKKP